MRLLSFIFTSILVAILAVVLGFRYLNSSIAYPVAHDIWWGRDEAEEGKGNEVTIEEMTPIHFADELLEDLKYRLANARYFESLQGTYWQYGGNMEDLKEIVDYWREVFDWRKQEEKLNTYNHFTAKINGIKLHYVHIKPATKTTKVIPIILIHGWPGSFYEFYKLIPLLTNSNNEDFCFEVICPSLPGHTLSEAPHKPGMNPKQIAKIFTRLMDALGFTSYYVQGGDWGSLIARTMAIFEPSHVRGVHVNFLPPHPPYGPLSLLSAHLFPSWYVDPKEDIKNVMSIKEIFLKIIYESGYFHLHATKPDSIGVALNDSPVGLAAYVIEKFFAWSGCKHNDSFSCVEAQFTKDELLTNVMLYWLTGSMPTAMRLYKENKVTDRSAGLYPVSVPTALAQFPKEVITSPKVWLQLPYPNMVQYTYMPRGGHFAAFEEPQLLADDIWKFVTKVEHDIHNA